MNCYDLGPDNVDSDKYRISVRCLNCGDISGADILVGTEARDHLANKVCKRCGCHTLVKQSFREII